MEIPEIEIQPPSGGKSGILTLKYPISGHSIENWDDFEKLVHTLAYNELRVAPEEHPILWLIPTCLSSAQRAKLVQMAFETFAFPAVGLITSAGAASVAANTPNCIVIDMGASSTTITPVVQGCALLHATQHLLFGGNDATNLLHHSFAEERLKSVEAIKQAVCFASPKSGFWGSAPIKVVCSSSSPVIVDAERHQVLEEHFSALSSSVRELLAKLDTDARTPCSQHILLIGRESLYPNVPERITEELNLVLSDYTLYAPPQRELLPWMGASLLGSLGGSFLEQFLVSLDTYDEVGPDRVERLFVY